VVEPAFKPGDSTLELLGALTPLIRKAGPAAHPDNLPRVTAQASAAAVWALYIGEQGWGSCDVCVCWVRAVCCLYNGEHEGLHNTVCMCGSDPGVTWEAGAL
jgi:hypothetical protein